MERDFMGVGGRELLAREDPRGGFGSSVHKPLPSKIQQFMPFNPAAAQDQTLKPSVFDHHMPPNGFHPTMGFDAHHKACSQKSFMAGKQSVQPYALHGFPSKRFESPNNQPSLQLGNDPRMPTIALGGSYFRGGNPAAAVPCQTLQAMRQPRGPGSGPNFPAPMFGSSTGGAFPRDRNGATPATSQLTIFYGGYVNVYDNVPVDKAQAIMFMAANSSSMSPTAAPVARSHAAPIRAAPPPRVAAAPDPATTNATPPKTNAASPCSGFSSPKSVVSHSAGHSTSSTSNPDERKGHATACAARHEPAGMSKNDDALEPSTSAMAKPVPMMRKLSLARFLEKRKERITNVSPYPLSEKPFENTAAPGSPAGAARPEHGGSKGKEWPWQGSTTTVKNSINSKLLNTELEI